MVLPRHLDANTASARRGGTLLWAASETFDAGAGALKNLWRVKTRWRALATLCTACALCSNLPVRGQQPDTAQASAQLQPTAPVQAPGTAPLRTQVPAQIQVSAQATVPTTAQGPAPSKAAAPPPLQLQLQPIPPLVAHVLDASGTLSAEAKQALELRLTEFERTYGSQIVVLMMPTTQPETLEAYSLRVANAWRLGRLGVGDGVLLLVARDDRRARLEVAHALKSVISDAAAKTVIDSTLQPAFRKGDFSGGLNAAVTQIIARISGAALLQPYPDGNKPASGSTTTTPPAEPKRRMTSGMLGGFEWIDMAVFLFVAVAVAARPVRNMLGRKVGGLVLGLGVGAVALFATGSLFVACIAALVALLWGLLAGNETRSDQARIDARHARYTGGRDNYAGSSGSTGGVLGGVFGGLGGDGGYGSSSNDRFSGGSFDSNASSSNDSFSSDGGGDFGGGGASGDW